MSSIQSSFNTLQYYTGTQNGVLIKEVSAIQRFVIERFVIERLHCIIIIDRGVGLLFVVTVVSCLGSGNGHE